MDKTKDVIIELNLEGLGIEAYGDYLAHAMCLSGIARSPSTVRTLNLKRGT